MTIVCYNCGDDISDRDLFDSVVDEDDVDEVFVHKHTTSEDEFGSSKWEYYCSIDCLADYVGGDSL